MKRWVKTGLYPIPTTPAGPMMTQGDLGSPRHHSTNPGPTTGPETVTATSGATFPFHDSMRDLIPNINKEVQLVIWHMTKNTDFPHPIPQHPKNALANCPRLETPKGQC